jgi:outer membrane protein assembly factor BamA
MTPGTRLHTVCRALMFPLLAAAGLAIGAGAAHAQDVPQPLPSPADTVTGTGFAPDSVLRDIGDVLGQILGRSTVKTEAELRPRKGLSIVALPSIGYNPAYGGYVGVGASAGGWLGDPQRTKISIFAFNATYSTTHQITFQLKSDAWVEGNGWNFKGDWRYLDTSQPTYGLGPVESQTGGAYPMKFKMWRIYETVFRHINGPFYAGLGYHLDHHVDIVDERAEAGEITPYTLYSRGLIASTSSSGFSANVLYDTRDNAISARRGTYWNSSLRVLAKELGGDDSWQMLTSDLRIYPRIPGGGNKVLAIWSTLWMTFGHGPYLVLPAIGWDTYGKTGRGYVQGRIRAPNQIYNEAEYRFPLTHDELFGGVVFVNATASTTESGAFSPLDPAAGLGLRIKFIKRTRTNLTIDYGWGLRGSKGLYLGTQEMF